MDSKLTLKLNKNSILKAKEYVTERKISLSKLVEGFFDSITLASNYDQKETTSYSPLVKELSGIISLSENYDYKAEYENYLREKYE